MLLGVETAVLRPTPANQAGKWYRGIVKTADGFMPTWRRAEVEKGWFRQANGDAENKGEKEKGGGRGGARGAAVLIPLSMKAENNWHIV